MADDKTKSWLDGAPGRAASTWMDPTVTDYVRIIEAGVARDRALAGLPSAPVPSTDSVPAEPAAADVEVSFSQGYQDPYFYDADATDEFVPAQSGAGYVSLPPAVNRDEASRAFNAAEKYPNEQARKHEIAETISGKELLDPEDHDRTTVWNSLAAVLEPLDYPRRAAWRAAYALGDLAPESTPTGEDPTTYSRAGDLLETLSEQVVGRFVAGDLLRGGGRLSDAEREAGRNFYQALSSGRLKELADKRGSLNKVPGVDYTPAGIDLLDATVPVGLARRLANEADDYGVRQFYEHLTEPLGREAVGLGMEMLADPLWAVAPAKGAKVLSQGDKTWTIAEPVWRAAQRLAEATGTRADDMGRQLLDMSRGDANAAEIVHEGLELLFSKAQEAEQVAARMKAAASNPARAVDTASREAAAARENVARLTEAYRETPNAGPRLAEAQANLARLAREEALLTNPVAASQYLRRVARKRSLAASRLHANATQARNGVAMLNKAKYITETGYFAMHLPGTRTTSYALSSDSARKMVETGSSLIPDRLATGVTRLTDAAAKLSPEGLAAKVGDVWSKEGFRTAREVLTPGEQVLWSAYSLGYKGVNATRYIFDIFAKTLGTRYIQPLMARHHARTQLLQEGAGGFVWRLQGSDRLARVPAEAWDTYMAAVTKWFDRTQSMTARLEQKMGSAVERARDVHDWRVANQKSEIAKADKILADAERGLQTASGPARSALHRRRIQALVRKQEASTWHKQTIGQIIEEAGDMIETGAGQLVAPLRAVADELSEMVDEVAAATGKERAEVEQALQAMARFGTGDTEAAEALEAMSRDLVRVVEDDAARQTQAFRTAAQDRIAEIDGLENLENLLGWDKLGEALESVARVTVGPRTRMMDQMVTDVLRGILKSDDLADEVMSAAARYMGQADGSAALQTLVATLRTADGGTGAAIRKGISALRGRLRGERDVLRRFARGAGDAVDEEAVGELAGVQLRRYLGETRSLVGDENMKPFMSWVRGDRKTPGGTNWEEARLIWNRAALLAARQAGEVGGTYNRISDALKAGNITHNSLGVLRDSRLRSEYFRGVVAQARTAEDAASMVSRAIGSMLPEGAFFRNLADTIGQKVGPDLFRADDPLLAATRAARDAPGMAAGVVAKDLTASRRAVAGNAQATLRAGQKHIAERLLEVRPRLEVPDGDDPSLIATKVLQDWERTLWSGYRRITEGLSDEDQLKAAFAVIRTNDPKGALGDAFEAVSDRYEGVFGTRFGDMPKEIEDVVFHLQSIFKSYEAMYEKFGWHFAKNPADRLRFWGVVDYVPHSEKIESTLAREIISAHRYERNPVLGTSSVDVRFSTGMDARKKREIIGSVREINRMVTDPDSAIAFGLDPNAIIARYLQANRAISAQEFLVGLTEGGVIRAFRGATREDGTFLPAWQAAAKEDFVPLFDRPNIQQGIDLILAGSRADYTRAGLSADDVKKAAQALQEWAVTSASKRGLAKDVSPLATWLREVPEYAQAANIEAILATVRAAQFNAGEDLYDVAQRFSELGSWEKVAREMSELAPKHGLSLKVSPSAVENYFAGDEAFRLYVPRAVQQSIEDIFSWQAPDKTSWSGKAYRAYLDLQNFWKVRLTIVSVAFTTRNVLSNQFQNMLDIGIEGVLSPKIQSEASRLAAAVQIADAYGSGSLRRAKTALFEADPLTPGRPIGAAGRALDKGGAIATWKASGLGRMVDDGIDLGDGMVRDIDEAIDLMRNELVVSESYTQFVDIAKFEAGVADTMLRGWGSVAKETLSSIEDLAMTTVPYFVHGMFVPPIMLPKEYGAALARYAENQGRLVNFLANMRKIGNVQESARLTQKFLFNYGDLTGFQKTWMRLLVPFFTWSQKNVVLQLEAMRRSPALYNKVNQVLLGSGPGVLNATDDDYRPSTIVERESNRAGYSSHLLRVRLPKWLVGIDNAYLEGLGLPIEGFAQQVDNLTAMRHYFDKAGRYREGAPAFKWMSQMSFLARLAVEQASGWSFYYDRPIEDLQQGEDIQRLLLAARRMAEYPVIGPLMAPVVEQAAQTLIDATEFDVDYRISKRDLRRVETPFVGNPYAQHAIMTLPYMRGVRDAAALADAHHMAYASEVFAMQAMGDTEKPEELDEGWRMLDAYSGIRLVQADEAMSRRIREFEKAKSMQRERRIQGATDIGQSEYIGKR